MSSGAAQPGTRPRTEPRAPRTDAAGGRGRPRWLSHPLWLQAGAVVGFVALWWIATAARLIDPLFLPSPPAVWDAVVRASNCHPLGSGSTRLVCGEQGYFLWEHVLASLQRIGLGVGSAILVGVALGFLMGMVPAVRTVLDPFVNFLRALPPLGYIGLLIVWFGIGDVSKIWLLFLAAFPPIALATIAGVDDVDPDRLNAVRSLGANRWQSLFYVTLPSATPGILHGIRVAVGFAWTTVVAAELNNGIPGIGALAYLAGTQLQTALTIGCIIVIGILAIALDGLFRLLSRVLVPWETTA